MVCYGAQMTPRQPTAKARPRRANSEGTNPHRRDDGRYQIYIRYTDAQGESARKSIYGQTREQCRDNADEFRRQLAKGISVSRQKETLGSTAAEWVETTLAISDTIGPGTKGQYAGFVRRHIIDSRLLVRVGSRAIAFADLPLNKLLPKHIELWLLHLRQGKEFDDLPPRAQARVLALRARDRDEEADALVFRLGKPPADSTVRNVFGVLRAVLEMAVRDQTIAVNPALAVDRPRIKDQEEAVFLEPSEVKQLLAVARHGAQILGVQGRAAKAGQSRFAPLFELLVNTGLRRGESLALRWSDVDLDARTVRVRGTLQRMNGELKIGPPKTPKSRRTIPLTVGAVAALKEVRARQREERLAAGALWQTSDYVFTTEQGHLCEPRNVLRALTAAGGRIGRSDITVHSLRHTFATTLLVAGVPLKVVSELLGHTSITITGDLYGHVSPAVSHGAMSKLTAALG